MTPEYRKLENYVSAVRNAENFVHVEHRHNNNKRDFLFVNQCAGKYRPTNAPAFFHMIKDLAVELEERIGKKQTVVIGMAETATAIAQAIARELPTCHFVMCTTREEITDAEVLCKFEEEHSHAPLHTLYLSKVPVINFDAIEAVVVIDDEITSGNTLYNLIAMLRRSELFNPDVDYIVGTVVDFRDYAAIERYAASGIDTISIGSGSIVDIDKKMDVDLTCIAEQPEPIGQRAWAAKFMRYVDIDYFRESRTGMYSEFNIVRGGYVDVLFSNIANKPTCVIGTEECMLPALDVAKELDMRLDFSVCSCSTARNSIDIIRDGSDNIQDKVAIPSVYDNSRMAYLYDVTPGKYGNIVLVTDAEIGKASYLCNYLCRCCDNFYVICLGGGHVC